MAWGAVRFAWSGWYELGREHLRELRNGVLGEVFAQQCEMASNLEKLDRVRILDKTLFNNQGHRPARRIRGNDNPVSERKPKQGLPKALYNSKWLDAQTEDYQELILSISEKSLKWLNLMTTG
jgi:hypothetical protein